MRKSTSSRSVGEWYDDFSPEESPEQPDTTRSENSDSDKQVNIVVAANKIDADSSPSRNVHKDLTTRAQHRKPRMQHRYTSGETTNKTMSKPKKYTDVESSSIDLQILNISNHKGQYGTYEDINGHKHSDNSLKRTSNPDIKRWLKEKEKAIREAKRQRKQAEKDRQAAAELEQQKMEERKLESDKQLRAWQAAKRKELRLLRRQNIAKRKLVKAKLSSSETDLTGTKNDLTGTKREVSHPQQRQPATVKPTAPTKPRPMSAPARRRKIVKPQVPIEQIIRESPDLRDRITQLERKKKLKHRQSYDEWLKIKDQEKKDTLKVIREQRQKLEKEISEETARIISDAAKRRIDNIR